MSTSKRKSLLSKIGGSLADSVGVREGEETLPIYATGESKPPRASFKRSRSDGEISIAEVIADPDQPRKEFNETEIERLGKSIVKHGQLQAIRVRWSESHDKWVIVAGERRWRAHLAVGKETIRCSFDDSGADTTTIRSQSIIENVLREDLTGMELARSLKGLMVDNSWSAVRVSEELNISKGKVSKALALLKLPTEIQDQVEAGTISPATGYEISRVKDSEKQQELAEQAAAGHVKSKEAAKKVIAGNTGGARRTRKTTNETFRTSGNVRIAITSRRDIGSQGMINALLEYADSIRQREQKAA